MKYEIHYNDKYYIYQNNEDGSRCLNDSLEDGTNMSFGTWEARQPIKDRNDFGYDRGDHFTIHEPWSIKSTGKNDAFTDKPYLSVQVKEVVEAGGGPADIYPYGSSLWKLFQKLKDNETWFERLN